MTPPAVAAPSRTRTPRAAAPPRRISGPARGRTAATGAAPPPLALRLGGAVHGLAEHRLLDRIIRGRAWIAILAVGLIGIVFMQVSMLRTNAGIGRAVETAGRLELENSAMQAVISELSSGDRIEAEASKLGLILAPGTPRFLDARNADSRRAVSSMTAPGEGIVAATLTSSAPPTTAGPTLSATGVAPSPPASSTTAAAPVASTAAPASSAAAPATGTTASPPAPAPAPAPQAQPVSTPAAAAPSPGETGGAAGAAPGR